MEPIRVVYDGMTYFKIMHWVQKAGKDEISGFGSVVKDGNIYRVVDAILLPQRNGAAHTEINGEDVGKAEYLLREAEGEMRLWWHSHVKMGCFWSGTDIDTIKELGQHGWILATVFNQHWEKRSAIYYGKDMEVFVDNLPTSYLLELPEEVVNPWDEEFQKNVEAHRFKPFQHVTKNASKAFLEWRKRQGKQLSKSERRALSERKDPVLAIFDTENYGRVIWRESDNEKLRKFLTPKDRAHVQVEVTRYELIKDIVEIRYISNEITQTLIWAAGGYQSTPFLEGFKALYDGEEKKEDKKDNVRQLPPATREGDDDLWNYWVPGTPVSDTMLSRMYPNWDTLTVDEKQTLREEWADANQGYPA